MRKREQKRLEHRREQIINAEWREWQRLTTHRAIRSALRTAQKKYGKEVKPKWTLAVGSSSVLQRAFT
jgi:hypothetical protein